MDHSTKNGTYYQIVNGQKVEVSKEVYEEICALNNKMRYQVKIEKRCFQADYQKCCGDCSLCSYQTSGLVISTEEIYQERNPSCASSEEIEEDILSKLTMQAVYQKADELVQNGGFILRMRYEENQSIREIAEKLGISHTAIRKR